MFICCIVLRNRKIYVILNQLNNNLLLKHKSTLSLIVIIIKFLAKFLCQLLWIISRIKSYSLFLISSNIYINVQQRFAVINFLWFDYTVWFFRLLFFSIFYNYFPCFLLSVCSLRYIMDMVRGADFSVLPAIFAYWFKIFMLCWALEPVYIIYMIFTLSQIGRLAL